MHFRNFLRGPSDAQTFEKPNAILVTCAAS